MDLNEFLTFAAIGFAAQIVDGALGMGFGLVSNAVLLAIGIPPAASSAAIHAAKVFTGGASALSHAWFRNIDRRVFLHLVVPGMVGGLIGALVLQRAPPAVLRIAISAYLALMGLWLLLLRACSPTLRTCTVSPHRAQRWPFLPYTARPPGMDEAVTR